MSLSPHNLERLIAEGQSLREGGSPRISAPAKSPIDEAISAEAGRKTGEFARPATSLQATWIDPEETEFTPVTRPGNAISARVFSLLVSAAIIAGLAWLIVPEVDVRIGALHSITVDNGVLSAQAVPLAPVRPAIVTELFVDPGALPDTMLPAGSTLARLEGTSLDGTRLEQTEIVVPFDARLASIDTLVGAVAQPGMPVATIYDPSLMHVIATVNDETLDLLRRDMVVMLHSDLLEEPIRGEIVSAVPLLGTDKDPSHSDMVNIRVHPDIDAVADLVPGIRFDLVIDLGSVSADATPLVLTRIDG